MRKAGAQCLIQFFANRFFFKPNRLNAEMFWQRCDTPVDGNVNRAVIEEQRGFREALICHHDGFEDVNLP